VQDGFIHYQLLGFCQATQLQYLNGQVPDHLQQQHVDHKIAEALLKKGHHQCLPDLDRRVPSHESGGIIGCCRPESPEPRKRLPPELAGLGVVRLVLQTIHLDAQG